MASLTLPNPGVGISQQMDSVGSPVRRAVTAKLAPRNISGVQFYPLQQRMAQNRAFVDQLGVKAGASLAAELAAAPLVATQQKPDNALSLTRAMIRLQRLAARRQE